jgi:hypothetical protein
MNKSEIQLRLQENHHRFLKQIMELPDADFLKSSNAKWTAGQQLDHLVKAVNPVNLAFILPHFLLRIVFGKANRTSRTYDELVEKYKSKLAAGGKASAPFIPPPIAASDREKLSRRFLALTASMLNRINSFSEEQLDTLILPHPLLGKLTFREMLYFTIYHAEHHEKQTLKNLENQQV